MAKSPGGNLPTGPTRSPASDTRQRDCSRGLIVFDMASTYSWDVTIGGRIEYVTDQDAFPDLFRAALNAEDGITLIRFDYPTVPHSTSAVIRISAKTKARAEQDAREVVVRVLGPIGSSITDGKPFGWAISADAVLAS